jgi:hypothetical protein
MSVFRTVMGISFLKENPSALPYSYNWLGFFILINVLLYAVIGQAVPEAQLGWIFLGHLFLQLGLFFGLLKYYQLSNRWLKLSMAILSSRLVILVATFLMGWAFQFSPQSFVFLFGLSATWFILILGHIVRCTLNTTLAKGILWAILIDILSNILISPFLKNSFELLGAA